VVQIVGLQNGERFGTFCEDEGGSFEVGFSKFYSRTPEGLPLKKGEKPAPFYRRTAEAVPLEKRGKTYTLLTLFKIPALQHFGQRVIRTFHQV
jgi:hypothetical protein